MGEPGFRQAEHLTYASLQLLCCEQPSELVQRSRSYRYQDKLRTHLLTRSNCPVRLRNSRYQDSAWPQPSKSLREGLTANRINNNIDLCPELGWRRLSGGYNLACAQ